MDIFKSLPVFFPYNAQSYFASIVWLYNLAMILSNHCPYLVDDVLLSCLF